MGSDGRIVRIRAAKLNAEVSDPAMSGAPEIVDKCAGQMRFSGEPRSTNLLDS